MAKRLRNTDVNVSNILITCEYWAAERTKKWYIVTIGFERYVKLAQQIDSDVKYFVNNGNLLDKISVILTFLSILQGFRIENAVKLYNIFMVIGVVN